VSSLRGTECSRRPISHQECDGPKIK
jgi:hypothetical protein